MNLIFTLVGLIVAWIGLIHFGPPRIYGAWNFVSVVLWVVFIGFLTRLAFAFFGILPSSDGGDRDT